MNGFPKTVLIIDDDPILSVVVEAFFRKRGSTSIQKAENGAGALRIIDGHEHDFDMVMCDLNMPEMDGVAFLRHLKDRNFSTPIAILSGEDGEVVKSAGKLAQLHNLNLLGALRKPLNLKELEDLIVNGPKNESVRVEGAAVPELPDEELARLLEERRVVPHFQPKIDVVTRQVSGLESLARLYHPDLGVLGPARFIDRVDALGLMPSLTEQMLEHSLGALAELRRLEHDLKMSINVTPVELNDLDFPNRLAEMAEKAGVSSRRVILEITESTLFKRTAEAAETLTRLRIKGFRISIDDFGTGFSNMEQLRQHPFSELKIDQSFVREALTDRFARACVETSVRFARELGLHIVAEGVETREQWDHIAEAGVHEVQGFLIAQPMVFSDLVPWLDMNRKPAGESRKQLLRRAV